MWLVVESENTATQDHPRPFLLFPFWGLVIVVHFRALETLQADFDGSYTGFNARALIPATVAQCPQPLDDSCTASRAKRLIQQQLDTCIESTNMQENGSPGVTSSLEVAPKCPLTVQSGFPGAPLAAQAGSQASQVSTWAFKLALTRFY